MANRKKTAVIIGIIIAVIMAIVTAFIIFNNQIMTPDATICATVSVNRSSQYKESAIDCLKINQHLYFPHVVFTARSLWRAITEPCKIYFCT